MQLVLIFIVLALIAYIALDFVRAYAPATGSTWEKLVTAGKGSATILWARFCALAGLLTTALVTIADYLGAPGVGDSIKAVMSPQAWGLVAVAVALISEAARRRTL